MILCELNSFNCVFECILIVSGNYFKWFRQHVCVVSRYRNLLKKSIKISRLLKFWFLSIASHDVGSFPDPILFRTLYRPNPPYFPDPFHFLPNPTSFHPTSVKFYPNPKIFARPFLFLIPTITTFRPPLLFFSDPSYFFHPPLKIFTRPLC